MLIVFARLFCRYYSRITLTKVGNKLAVEHTYNLSAWEPEQKDRAEDQLHQCSEFKDMRLS